MIELKTAEQIELMARAGALLGRLYEVLPTEIRPGRTTAELDAFAEEFIRDHPGAAPAFKGLYGFPATLCTSVNEEVVHGIPSAGRTLVEGDVLSVDCGVKLEGYFADAAITVPVGVVSDAANRLLEVTRDALDQGISAALAGGRLGDIGAAIHGRARSEGYGVVRDLVGHGIGREPHEEPQVPNWGRAGRGLGLSAGLVLAIEPMFNLGTPSIRTLGDEWTVVTADGSLSAHFEHTVAITDDGPRILTMAPEPAPAEVA